MNNEEWYNETQRRAGLVSKFFKPKEILNIQDFIETAKDVSKEEKERLEELRKNTVNANTSTGV